ncbi:ribosomal protein S6 modification protein [Sporosarcina newyorkensis 2681]|uniref:Ribosomal protein S6 modification protein n=1 Tax=Sporosarcina newyorkensis 2681 TaxID=1027292 RepID=F9DVL0_9BACL|nr:RimK family alpha-L-glutamate ligase [Sporosarcina newyorkensis]EGQ22514.1 ribosomal protein S6 modification protein [Sporosarcina newyorkensis 2681]
MKSCWVIYNGSLTSGKFADQAQLIQEAAERAGVQATILKNYELPMNLQESIQNPPDFVVFLDKDTLLASYLKQAGIPVFNDPDVIETCDNKAKQYLELANADIPMPRTIIAPKVYANFTIRDSGYYERVLDELGLPMIIKEGHGSFGMKVYLIESEESFYEKVDALRGVDYVFQEFIETSRGRDLRVNIVGDTIVAAMYRYSETDFRANITNGGIAEVVDLTAEQESLALRAAKAVGAQFAGVDLLYGANEEPLVCEVNAAAHIRNIYTVTGINVADAMIEYILGEIQ